MTVSPLPPLKIKSADESRRCLEFIDFLFSQVPFVLAWSKDDETRRMTRPQFVTWKNAAQSERAGAFDAIDAAKRDIAAHPFANEIYRLMDAINARLAELDRQVGETAMMDRLRSMGYDPASLTRR